MGERKLELALSTDDQYQGACVCTHHQSAGVKSSISTGQTSC